MKITLDMAFKLQKNFASRIDALKREISSCMEYIATDESADIDRPAFSFVDCMKEIKDLESKVIALKHSINIFNTTHIVCDDMTMDAVLVKLACLSQQKMILDRYDRSKERVRQPNRGSNIVEYKFRNFDVAEFEEVYHDICAKILALQTAINITNTNSKIEIPFEI